MRSYLDQYQNAAWLELIFFGVISVVSFVLLIILFSDHRFSLFRKKQKSYEKTHQINIQNLGLQFIEGFIDGVTRPPEKQ